MRLLGNSTFDKLRACPEFIEGVNGTGNKIVERFPFALSPSKPELVISCLINSTKKSTVHYSSFPRRREARLFGLSWIPARASFSLRLIRLWRNRQLGRNDVWKYTSNFRVTTLVLVLVTFSLAGCGSLSPKPDPSRFFTLTAIAQPGAMPAKGSTNSPGVSLGIGPVRLPGYLDRQEIVTRVSQNRIDVSEYDRWAEPLETNFTRVVGQNLSVLLHTDRLVFYPWELNRRPNYQVTIEVLRFESNNQGEVQLSARWEILDTNKRMPLQAGESGITRQPTAQSTDASVAALSEALGDLSREIANAVSAVDGQRK
jgi:uncharacterized lipoprotein YmbA